MLFNSFEFAIYLPIVFVIYWFLVNQNLKHQNFFLLLASYFFYGWWDWRFLSLIAFSSLIDYYVGRGLKNETTLRKRKLLLLLSVTVNIGFLGFFKYYNFFAESFAQAFTFFGKNISINRLNIILPVGISFYTFQTLSYSIDVYRKKLKPTNDILAFFAYVSFFPQLVAGPIERATNLLPQFYSHRKFNRALSIEGLRQILWGLFKKVVVADTCAIVVNFIFKDYSTFSTPVLWVGAIFFAFQIYGDFSGYSDIAIGTSKLFGFNIMTNFKYPYFSRDIAEFWRRWHISLSTWFRDYIYIPLGGSRRGKSISIRNTFIIFIVSGFWHGANWTFIAWGFLNALYFLPLLLLKMNRKNTDTVAEKQLFPTLYESLQILFTFLITVIAWVFFRSQDLPSALDYISIMFSELPKLNWFSYLLSIDIKFYILDGSIFISILLIIEWFNRHTYTALDFLGFNKPIRYALYIFFSLMILIHLNNEQSFIYFQF